MNYLLYNAHWQETNQVIRNADLKLVIPFPALVAEAVPPPEVFGTALLTYSALSMIPVPSFSKPAVTHPAGHHLELGVNCLKAPP